MRLIQFFISGSGRRVGVVEGNTVFDLTGIQPGWDSVYGIFTEALHSGQQLDEHISGINFHQSPRTLDYQALLTQRPGERTWLLPPLDHPDPAHCIVAGTGLTHLGSAAQRNSMHTGTEEVHKKTDSRKMFEMGLERGKPGYGERGVQPEWFYKGTGSILRGHNDFLDIPAFCEDCGEEPEIAGCYVTGTDGVPYRLGFAIGNEWSDHITEKVNYLWLAASKLRTCAIGPELVTDQTFKDIRGYCRIQRGDTVIYDSDELLTGEDNMSHSLANLEDHYFKFPQFRVPGDVHIHFFGTMKLSTGSRDALNNNDQVRIHFEGMGGDLVNYVKRVPAAATPVTVRKG